MLSLFVMFVLMSAGAMTISLTLSRQSVAKTAKEVDRAFVSAEAGVNLALYELQINTDIGADGLGNTAGDLGEGGYAVTLLPPYAGAGQYTLQSVGAVGGVRRGVEAVIVEESGSVLGFTGINNLSITGGFLDSYDSDKGDYSSQVGAGGFAGSEGLLGSNFDVDLTGANQVYGDATPGPTGSVTGNTAGVTGSTAPAPELQVFDAYVYAPTIPSAGPLNATTTLTTGTHRYSSIMLTGMRTLLLDGEVELFIDGDVNISTLVTITAGSNVTIHHGTGNFKVGGAGIINLGEDPRQLQVLSATTDTVTVSGTSAFYGTLYVPDGELAVSGNGGLFGGALAGQLDIKAGSVHQDLSLSRVGGGGFSILMMRPVQP